jgi:SAM-dependent methyltransferase
LLAPLTPAATDESAAIDPATASGYACRFCGHPLKDTFVDLGMSPLCQTHIEPRHLNAMEPFYPLHTYVCSRCFLVQLPEHVSPAAIFEEYAYFSSYSDTMLQHARGYVDAMSTRLGLGPASSVVELASNDGYLLQYFVQGGIPALGIEPARNVAEVAVRRGVPTLSVFFGRETAQRVASERGRADLILGNNVLAHVPDINDFVGGMRVLLKPGGVVTMEFPHLLRLIERNQFDTIYHEHFSYLSFTTVEQIFAAQGLTLFDVDEIPIHGGSIRIYARHQEDASKPVTEAVKAMKAFEAAWGVTQLAPYQAFGEQVKATKRRILQFFIDAKQQGKTVAGYGAPGKGNTLLNYCGIREDFLTFAVDRNPYKQGKFTPGTRIPISPPERIREDRPDYLFVLAWNLLDEVMQQNAFIREWGGKFVSPIPELKVYD